MRGAASNDRPYRAPFSFPGRAVQETVPDTVSDTVSPKQIEMISLSENKHITAWGDTRNKADHGRFDEITSVEVVGMVTGVRALIEKHLS